MTRIYYETPDMAVVNELKKRNAKTFGGNVRRKDRLDRFLKFEEKHRLSAQRAMWRRSRGTSRGLRHYQLWSSDHLDYGQLLHEDPVEPVEEYAPLAVDNGFSWSAVFFTIVGIVLIHLLTAMITIMLFVWRQNGFLFA
jgi:hypothetical protein